MERHFSLKFYKQHYYWQNVKKGCVAVIESLIMPLVFADTMFGGELNKICAKEKQKVPIFVTLCIEEIERRGKIWN